MSEDVKQSDISQQTLRINTDMFLKQFAKCRQDCQYFTAVFGAFGIEQIPDLRKRMFEKWRTRLTASAFCVDVIFRQMTQPGIHTQDRLSMPIFDVLNDFIQFLKKSYKGLSRLFCGFFSIRIGITSGSQFTVNGQGVDRGQEFLTLLETLNIQPMCAHQIVFLKDTSAYKTLNFAIASGFEFVLPTLLLRDQGYEPVVETVEQPCFYLPFRGPVWVLCLSSRANDRLEQRELHIFLQWYQH